ncbi:orotidine 5'-phosphate decarboxylase PyrG [Plectosphaerella plurivora]|uniref:Orotidine 5'-phosphate decarboxylase n=1 Tax=Plectosphaerella plurivora TaxID=936078 RepID=A0A9P8VNW1_9PEZI|nr:orotidine 5'-phosphate decarboxylase PyrG [Plectosphaerella plurivora]
MRPAELSQEIAWQGHAPSKDPSFIRAAQAGNARHLAPHAGRLGPTKKTRACVRLEGLLALADALGPYIAVFKTHMDIVRDFGDKTVEGLLALAKKHNFLIFEDRKFVDIGATAQKQYHSGALRISEWADFVNVSILGGAGVVEALEQVLTDESFPSRGERALLILAEMTTVGSLAVDNYTEQCITVARRHTDSVVGFVATRRLGEDVGSRGDEDFVVFTTGVSSRQSGDSLGQQYQTPAAAVKGGSDFVIIGRDIYLDENPVEAAKRCQADGRLEKS